MQINSTKFSNFFINCLFFLTFTQVCISLFSYIIYIVLLILFVITIFYLLKNRKVERNFLKLLTLFMLPVLISSTIGVMFSVIYENRLDYSQLFIFGRITNLILIFVVMLFIATFSFQKNFQEEQYFSQIKCYWLGCFILLLTAIWHLLSLHTNIILFPFDTRSNVHGTTNIYSFARRVTGIAEEPSYLTPFIIDFFIFTFLIFKNRIIRLLFLLFSLTILLFTFSPSGYIAFFASYIFATIFVLNFSLSIRKLFFYLLVVFLLIICIFFMMEYLYNFSYLFDRLDSLEQSARFETIIKSINLTFDSNIASMLFGHGVKSFSLLQQITNFDSGNAFFITSNNLFIDNLWETGLIGILIYIIGFFIIFRMIFKCRFSKKQRFILWFIFSNWLFTSFYRADYANLHFFVLLYFMYILSRYRFDLCHK